MITKLTDMQQLSLDIIKGSVKEFSVEKAEDVIRKAVLDVCGGQWNYNSYRKHKYEVFEIIEEALSVSMGTILLDQFNGFADFRNTELGDTIEFVIEDNSLFRVGTIANGTKDLRRQELYIGSQTIQTEKVGIKVYTEFDLFMAGRVNFGTMVTRVALSFNHEVGNRIYKAMYASYSALSAPYAVNGAFSEANLQDMIAHVEAATGRMASIYGTKKALGKITSVQYSENMKDQLNQMGYLGTFKGTPVNQLPQAHVAGTDTFAVADDFLMVIPEGNEKIVKVVFEGAPYMEETSSEKRNDMQLEYLFMQRLGVMVLTASKYGIYKLA